jgi:putative ABC transport system ATP-binding protein
MNTLLESKQLSKTFTLSKQNEHRVLKDVNLTIAQGDYVAVMGASGSGKSTLLYNMSGMDRLTSGSVTFRGQELSHMHEQALAALRLTGMGFVFQHIHLLKNLSIFDNILLPGYLARKEERHKIDQRARELMEHVGVAQLADHDITQASGGQLQRVGICRALINEPDILFGDEPTGALNSTAADEIMALFASINAAGTTIMLVTHDVKVAAQTERILFMLDGQIVSEKCLGKPSRTGADRKTREEQLSNWLFKMGF